MISPTCSLHTIGVITKREIKYANRIVSTKSTSIFSCGMLLRHKASRATTRMMNDTENDCQKTWKTLVDRILGLQSDGVITEKTTSDLLDLSYRARSAAHKHGELDK